MKKWLDDPARWWLGSRESAFPLCLALTIWLAVSVFTLIAAGVVSGENIPWGLSVGIALSPMLIWVLIATPMSVGRIASVHSSEALLMCPNRQASLIVALASVAAIVLVPALLIGALIYVGTGMALGFSAALLFGLVFVGINLLFCWYLRTGSFHNTALSNTIVFLPVPLMSMLGRIGVSPLHPIFLGGLVSFSLIGIGLRVWQIVRKPNLQNFNRVTPFKAWLFLNTKYCPSGKQLWVSLCVTLWAVFYSQQRWDAMFMLASGFSAIYGMPDAPHLRQRLSMLWLNGHSRLALVRYAVLSGIGQQFASLAICLALMLGMTWIHWFAADKLLLFMIAGVLGTPALRICTLNSFARQTPDEDSTPRTMARSKPKFSALAGVAVLAWMVTPLVAYIYFKDSPTIFFLICALTSGVISAAGWTSVRKAFQRIEL